MISSVRSLAERLCSTLDRVDPARVHGSFDRVNAEHLRRILAKYASYYNELRTHVSLEKDAPYPRPVARFGDIVARVPSLIRALPRKDLMSLAPQGERHSE